MRVVGGIVRHHQTRCLDVGALEIFQQAMLVSVIIGHAVIADQRLSEDENLASIGGVGQGLGVADQRGGEDGLARDVGGSAERFAGEDRAILQALSIFMVTIEECALRHLLEW